MANTVSVSAVPFNPNTQIFGAAPTPSMGTVNLNQPSNKPVVPQPQVNPITPPNIPQSQNISTFNTTKVNLPQQRPTEIQAPAVNSAFSGLQNIQTPVQDTANNISKAMLQIIPQLSGVAQEQAAQESSLGVTQMNKQLTDLNNQMLQRNAELNASDVSLAQGLQNIQDQAIPMEFITGQQASLQNQANLARAVKVSNINMLNALAQSVQGNIAMAKQTAKEAVDLKYAPIKDMYNTLQAQLTAIQPMLTAEEKRTAAQQTAMYELQKTLLTNKQNQETKFMDLILKAPTDYGSTPEQIGAAMATFQKTGDIMQAAQELTGAGATAITEYYNTQNATRNALYNNVGQITIDNGYDLNAFKKGMAGVESSNNYKAEGPIIKDGFYKGQQALGKYQVMPGNLPTWLKQAGLPNMTPQEFLNSPDAQEKVFENQSLTNYAKYGNWDDVASVWFSGKPLSKNTSSDGYNTVPEYVAKVRANMGIPVQPTTLSMVVDPRVKLYGDEYIRQGKPADFFKTLPKYIRPEAVLAYANQNVDNTPQVQSLVEKINNLDSLINSPYLGSVVGPNFLSRGVTANIVSGVGAGGVAGALAGAPFAGIGALPGAAGGAILGGITGFATTPQFSGKAASFIGDVELLTSAETIDNLIKAKAQGATFGALSESEQQMLKNAATKINNWAIKNGEGKVVGYNIDEESFIKELNRLKSLAQKGIAQAGGNVLGGNITDVYYNSVIQPLQNTSTTTYGYTF